MLLTANLPRNLPVKKIVNRLRFDRIMVMSPWPRFLAHPVVWLLLLAYFVVPQTVDGWVGLSTVVRLCIPCPNCILKWLSREHNCLWRDSSLDALTLQQVMLLLDYCNLSSRCVTSASLLMSERILEGKHVVFTAQRYVMAVWLWLLYAMTIVCVPVCLSIRPTPGDVVSNRLNLLLFIIYYNNLLLWLWTCFL